ncbi:MAG: hypothetical protein V7K20_01650 [Nostoc sp.]
MHLQAAIPSLREACLRHAARTPTVSFSTRGYANANAERVTSLPTAPSC